jgi:deazaflavin-dependent oxidoreductase (nitroreductase family)
MDRSGLPWKRARYTLSAMKHRIIHFVQKYLLNPPIKLLFVLGLAPPGYVLLETIGRKTGKPRRTPVGNGRVGEQFWIIAEHGMQAGYARNMQKNPRVRLKLRQGWRYRWHSGTAQFLPEDDPRERQSWLACQLPGSSSNAAAVRLFGTDLLTVRIDLDA